MGVLLLSPDGELDERVHAEASAPALAVKMSSSALRRFTPRSIRRRCAVTTALTATLCCDRAHGWHDARVMLRRAPLVLLLACGPAATSSGPTPPPHATSAPASAPGLAHRPELRASFSSPSHVPYDTAAVGIGGVSVTLTLTNAGPSPVDTSHVTLVFRASRQGVDVPCVENERPVKEREPSTLAAGESFAFERHLACAIRLPGHYDLGVSVRVAPGDPADEVANVTLDVDAGPRSPLPVPGHPGLYAMLTGDRATPPLPPASWARGDYHVVVVVVNASTKVVPVGPAKVAFSTFKKGSSLPCSGQADPIELPESLGPGEVKFVKTAVACAPSEEGEYEIVGRLSLGGSEVDVGKVGLRVSRDPLLFAPQPLP